MKTNCSLLLGFLLITLLSCSKSESNSNSNCEFIGEWCLDLGRGPCIDVSGLPTAPNLIFQSKGDLVFLGLKLQWKSGNCKTLEVSGQGQSTMGVWQVTLLNPNLLILDRGTGVSQEFSRK